MGLVVNTNVSSLMTQKSVQANQLDLNQAIDRLSSGKRINSAADDAAGLSIASRMEAQVRGLDQAVRNANDGISLVQASEGAMEEITAMLQRMRELAVQASNGVLTAEDRTNLQEEVSALQAEIDRVVDTTTFNNQKVLDGSFGKSLQIGMNAGQTVSVDIANLSALSLGGVTGAADTNAIVTANARGTEATPTETRLDFSNNDDYTFTVMFEVDGKEYSFAIDASVEDGSAKQIVDEINDKLTGKPDGYDITTTATTAVAGTANSVVDLSSVIEVSYVGKQVTLKNLQGGDIKISQGATVSVASGDIAVAGNISAGGGQVTVTSVAGGANSQNAIIGDDRFATRTFANTGKTGTAAVTAADAVATEVAVNFSGATIAASGGTIQLIIGGTTGASITVAASATAATLASTIATNASVTGFTFSASGNVLTVSKTDGTDFTFDIAAGSVASGSTLSVADTGGASTAFSIGTAASLSGGTEAIEAVDAIDGGTMYLDFLANDKYTFEFANSSGTVLSTAINLTYEGTAASLTDAATTINTVLQSAGGTFDFTATVDENRIKIVENGGNAFKIQNFASDGAGKAIASVASGQASGVEAVLLDDTTYTGSVITNANGVATATKLNLTTFGSEDTYSFTISDGTATAVVNPTLLDTADGTSAAGSAADMKNAVAVALARAGLDDVISVTASAANTAGNATGDFTLQLTHKLGYKVTIDDFASTGAGQMLVQAGSGSTGTAAYLNDNLNGDSNTQVVSNVNVGSQSLASDSISILDRAIADVDSQRSKLGAIQNRLEHTVSNLTNISVNTSAAQSRIMDADYAVESANLAKAQIMQQASAAMLAQANASGQIVLSLLG